MLNFYKLILLACSLLTPAINYVALAQVAQHPNKAPLPLDELRIFSEVFTKIKNSYVEEISDKELMRKAIRGMLSDLDPHSSYLEGSDYFDLHKGATGEFGGIGIEVAMEDGFIRVIAPIDGTPAAKAEIRSGDLIIRLNGMPVKKMSLEEAVNLMRGEPGTTITLMILRDGQDMPFDVVITRAVIMVESVKHRLLEPGYGYIRISNFQTKTGEELHQHFDALKQEMDGNLRGLILDLRDNPGGTLNSAVLVSDLFLKDGLIVYTEGRDEDEQFKFKAKPLDILNDLPLVVLINGGSASASEIVAGAIQDHKRGLIIGEKSFGKGSVQTILEISNSSAVKLTTARYYTPTGRSIQADGITPDVFVAQLAVALKAQNNIHIKESDLSGHLEQDGIKETIIEQELAETADDRLEISTDYQLYVALNVLKGLAFGIKSRIIE